MSIVIEPFKCDDAQIKAGFSCEKQKEIWENVNNLWTGKTTLAPNSVGVGSGLGDASWHEALNYEKIQTELAEKLSEEAKQNSIGNIATLTNENKNKDKYIYGIVGIAILGVIIYEFINKK